MVSSSGNAKESLALMPLHKARERLMLKALHRYGSGPDGGSHAWLSLPHSMRVFYLHAYCSRLWNEAACFRLQALGSRPVEGDLVLAASCSQAEEETQASQVREVTPVKAVIRNEYLWVIRQLIALCYCWTSFQVHVITAADEHDGAYLLDQVQEFGITPLIPFSLSVKGLCKRCCIFKLICGSPLFLRWSSQCQGTA